VFSKNSAATVGVAGAMVGTMLFVAIRDVQAGMPPEQADLIPAAQLATGSVGSTSSVIVWHLDTVSGTDYAAAPYTTPLRLNGLTDQRGDTIAIAPLGPDGLILSLPPVQNLI
jgi:hypothetical protein